MFLLDTNVVSELRKERLGKADANVIAWATAQPQEALFLSAVTILEIELGILQIERRDPKQAAPLRTWLEAQVIPAFEGRILSVDVDVARRTAKLHVPDPAPERDALIAATAFAHGLTVATRNVVDFERTNVFVLNPWDG